MDIEAQGQRPAAPAQPEGQLNKWRYRLTRASWWHLSYALDYFLIVVIGAATLVVEKLFTPFDRYLPPGDPSVMFPIVAEKVPLYVSTSALPSGADIASFAVGR
jgi:hypothetical protein